MVAFQEKQAFRRFIYSRPVFAVLFVVFIFLGLSLVERFQIERETRAKLLLAEREQEILLSKEADLKNRLERLESPRGTEEEIRKKFRVAKDGEGVIIIVDSKATTSENNQAGSFIGWLSGFF